MTTTMSAQVPDPVSRQPSLLQIERLQRPAIGPVSLDVAAGECVCISGPSGTGKSQLLRAIADLDPHDGEVRLSGHAATTITPPEWRRQVGLLPPESSWWLPRVTDHFHPGVPLQLAEVGLTEAILEQAVARLSSGEKQRLALLRLLANQPRVLLLDEPTRGIDVGAKAEVHTLMSQLAQTGIGIVMISSELPEILGMSDRILVMSEGRVAAILDRKEATQEVIMTYASGEAENQIVDQTSKGGDA